MTSHLLGRVQSQHHHHVSADGCAFCDIIEGRQEAHIVADTEDYIAFLDILPIRTGHVLVVPKAHVPRISNLSNDQAAAIMNGVVAVTRAMEKGFQITGVQVAANQEYAQTVDHVHIHIVPAPLPSNAVSPLSKWNKTSSTSVLFGRRDELDEEEAKELITLLQPYLQPLSKL